MKKEEEYKFYDDKFYAESSERERRVKELLLKEEILRKEKNRLIREKSWYKKPQNLIAIFGVLIPLLASYIINVSQEDKKELSIYHSPVEALITDSEHLRTNVIVKQDSSEVNNISKLSLTIKNTGTLSLSKSDFLDGPINIILKQENNSIPIKILDVFNRENANQQKSELKLINDSGNISYLPSLMNENDEVIIDIYLMNSPKVKVDFIGKLVKGNIVGPYSLEKTEITYGFKTFVLSIVSFFKYKWIAIAMLILIFVLTALTTLFQIAMMDSKELDPQLLGILMVMTTGLISIFSIILIIYVLIY